MAWPDELTLFGIMTWWNGLTGWGRLTALIFVSGFVFLVARLIRGTSSGELISELIKIREQAKACHQALVELETRAGIAEAAEKLRDDPPWYDLVYDAAERGSDEHRELEKEVEKSHQERTSRRIRELYFQVRDTELRKELITKDREEESLARSYLQQEMYDARDRLKAARAWGKEWWVWASIGETLYSGACRAN